MAFFAVTFAVLIAGSLVAQRLDIGFQIPLMRQMLSAEPAESKQVPIGNSETFSLCGDGPRINCVVDGDTFWFNHTKIRIADIDTPETHPSRCAEEQRLGDAATQRLQALLNEGPFQLVSIDRDEDVYGRKLRIVERSGESLGAQIVADGLARPWTGRRKPWCG